MARPSKPSATPRFNVGDEVRAKPGVTVPGFEDIPMGGWSGTIEAVEQVEGRIDYEVGWDRRTLDAMHPVYRKRCERDDLEPETMWLTEDDLGPDDGSHTPIERPTSIVTPPLSERDQNDRVRMALGLTHDDPLPEISVETLLAYHRYLKDRLKFPFNAYCGDEEIGPFSHRRATMTVTGLRAPERESLDVEDGLVCSGRVGAEEIETPLADIELRSKKKDPNHRLISDYAYWFDNWPSRDVSGIDPDEDEREFESDIPPPSRRVLIKVALVLGVGGCLLGATIGAALGTLGGSGLAVLIGGIPLAILGAFLLGRYAMASGAVGRFRFEVVLGMAFGLVCGGGAGAVAGLAVVALPWSLLGLLAGMFLGPYMLPKRQRRRASFRVASLGTCVGILVSAFRHGQARAASGASSGAITGLTVAAGLVLLFVAAVSRLSGEPVEHDIDAEDGEFERVQDDDVRPRRS